jgi:hypothetical protein
MLNETHSDASVADTKPTPEEIRNALNHLLRQPEFQGSSRIKKFLTFVVERSLEGQSESLKAPVIAKHVFDRDENFDAYANPIVRVEATRLRKVLRAVYDRPDFHENVEVELPLGSYAPNFRYRGVQQTVAEVGTNTYAASLWRDPILKSQRDATKNSIAQHQWSKTALFSLAGLVALSFYLVIDGRYEHASLQGEVARVEVVDLRPTVYVPSFSRKEMPPQVHLSYGQFQRVVVDSFAQFDSIRLRSSADQASRESDFQVSFDLTDETTAVLTALRPDRMSVASSQARVFADMGAQTILSQQRIEWRNGIAKLVAGMEFDMLMRNRRSQSLTEGLNCAARAREYQSTGSSAARDASLQCLQQALARADAFLAHARLSALWFDDYAMGRVLSDKRDGMQESFRHAQQSLLLAPHRAASLSSYARILVLTGAEDRLALQFARSAHAANPLDADARAILGSVLIVLGEYAEGISHLKALIETYPQYPSWVRLYLFVAAIETGDLEARRDALAPSDRAESPFGILARFAMNVMEGNHSAGEAAFHRLASISPEMADRPASVFMRLRLRGPKMQQVINRLNAPN